jgi:isochorismate pyruvate lyase
MPHIIVKLYPGRSDELKTNLANKVTEALVEAIGAKEEGISVDIQEVQPESWVKGVFKTEILANYNRLYKKPGYGYSDEELNSCTSLEEVRDNIDRIDRKIINLISERSFYVKEASKFKKDEKDVEAPKRFEEVIEKVRSLAKENNVSEEIVGKIYRTMISSFIELEKNEFTRNRE